VRDIPVSTGNTTIPGRDAGIRTGTPQPGMGTAPLPDGRTATWMADRHPDGSFPHLDWDLPPSRWRRLPSAWQHLPSRWRRSPPGGTLPICAGASPVATGTSPIPVVVLPLGIVVLPLGELTQTNALHDDSQAKSVGQRTIRGQERRLIQLRYGNIEGVRSCSRSEAAESPRSLAGRCASFARHS